MEAEKNIEFEQMLEHSIDLMDVQPYQYKAEPIAGSWDWSEDSW